MNRPLLVAALMLPLGLAPQVGAATPGPQKTAVYVSMKLQAGHTYEVFVLAAEPLSGAPDLQLTVRDLTRGGETAGYDGELPAGALSVTDTGASLRTQVAGRPLVATWTTNRGVAASGDDAGSSGPGYQVVGHAADVQVAFGDARCTISAFGVVGYAVADAASDSLPLSRALAGVDLDGARCGDVDHSTLP